MQYEMPADDEEDRPSDEAIRKALERVGKHARRLAQESNQPIVVEKNGQIVWLYADGITMPYVAKDTTQKITES